MNGQYSSKLTGIGAFLVAQRDKKRLALWCTTPIWWLALSFEKIGGEKKRLALSLKKIGGAEG